MCFLKLLCVCPCLPPYNKLLSYCVKLTTCTELLVAWQLLAPCECHRSYVLSSVLVLLAKDSNFGGQLSSLMWKWDGKATMAKTQYGWGEKEVSGKMDQLLLWRTDKVICLMCKQVNLVLKEFNVKYHHEINHKSYDKFIGEECKRMVKQFQWGLSLTSCINYNAVSLKSICIDLALVLPS